MSAAPEFPTLFLGLVVLVLAGLLLRERLRTHERARVLFERWQAMDMTSAKAELAETLELKAATTLDRWKLETESTIRKDAIRRSQATVSGKATEHLVPLLPDFPFDPRDARFLGAPVDFIVFDGLSAGDLHEIVFVEVKTGAGADLSPRERRVRDAVLEGRVGWKVLRIAGPDQGSRSSFG
jgi:predicted Holliday junction resolvase-like endonuclease